MTGAVLGWMSSRAGSGLKFIASGPYPERGGHRGTPPYPITMHHAPICSDCGDRAPQTKTDQTLLSAFGWRLTRRVLVDGMYLPEWRCPACWKVFRATREEQTLRMQRSGSKPGG